MFNNLRNGTPTLNAKIKVMSVTPLYPFHPLHRHLEVSRVITAGTSALYIAGSQTQTGELWFSKVSR